MKKKSNIRQTLMKFRFYVLRGVYGFDVEIFAQSENDATVKLKKILNPEFSTKIERIEELLLPDIKEGL